MTRSLLAAGCAISALSLAFNTPALAQATAGSAPGANASATAAQAPGSPQARPADASAPLSTELSEVVVTGVANGGLKKLDAAYSVTSLSQEKIKESNSIAFADILKSSPGVYVETSGGPTGANVELAGFPGSGGAPYVTIELNGASLFPMSTVGYAEPTTLFRLDDSVDRLELVQGGPGVLYGNGQPGLTVNYILKQGTDKLSGDVGVTYGSEGAVRFDGFVGGPLSEKNGLYASVGGFWNSSDNEVRNPQFAAEGGGQVTATLTKKWNDGSLLVYGRYLKYDAEFETDTPIYNPALGQFSAYTGFSPLTGTFESKADQYEQLQVAPCTGSGCSPGSLPVNMANGRGPDMYTVGGEFKWNFSNGIKLLDDFSYTNGATHMVAFYSTSLNPEPLSTYIANAEAADKLPGGLVASA
jgi:outer membrane receptor protein involved in Fe transport